MKKAIDEAIKSALELGKIIGDDISNESDDDPNNDKNKKEEEKRDEDENNGDGGDSGGENNVPSYKTGTLTWSGTGASRTWTDATGKTYSANSAEGKAIQAAFNKAYNANGGYKGDYWLGWNKLDADVLHNKYGLSTGGYTGDWAGSYGKLAFLHQKELVLNAKDTENLLASMDILDKIISTIDLYSNNAQLGGILSSPHFSNFKENDVLEQ